MKIEIFAGYGAGTANGSIDSGKRNFFGFAVPTNRVDADYQQYFLQLNAAISDIVVNTAGKEPSATTLKYGSVFRVSKSKYSNFRKNGESINLNPMEGSFIQLGLFGSIGGSGLGLIVQTGWLYPIADDANRPSYSPLYISAGLIIGIW